VIPRDIARAVIVDETPKVIPGSELLLVAEVISPGSSSERTDRVRKVREYASLGIPQYWIAGHSPEPKVQVLALGENGYVPGVSAAAGANLPQISRRTSRFPFPSTQRRCLSSDSWSIKSLAYHRAGSSPALARQSAIRTMVSR
jgi:hypothetical protein